MNTQDDIESFFYALNEQSSIPIKAENRLEGSNLNFNPNKYLNLDFNTLDNFDSKIAIIKSSDIGTLNINSEIIDFINTTPDGLRNHDVKEYMNTIMESSIYGNMDVLLTIKNEIKQVQVTGHNIVNVLKEDIKDKDIASHLVARVQVELDNIDNQKKYFQNVLKTLGKLRDFDKFYKLHEGSLDIDECMLLNKKLNRLLLENSSILKESLHKDIQNKKSDFIKSRDEIKEVTYELIKIGKSENIKSQYVSLADDLIHKKTMSTEVSNFLFDKLLADDTDASVQLNNQHIQYVHRLNDGSIIIRNKNNDFKTIIHSKEYVKLMETITKELMSIPLKNKPKLVNHFHNKFLEDGFTLSIFNAGMNTINTYAENEHILKNMKINLLDITNKGFEQIDDYLNEQIKIYKINQFTNSILSSKYKFLHTEESDPYLKDLYEKNLTEKDLQNYIGKKLAALKSPDDFTQLLKEVFNKLDGFTFDAVNIKLNKHTIEPLYNKENVIAFEIENYTQCKDFGSPSWCIHRQESYFDYYTSDHSKQLIIYDFNKDSMHNESVIGFTINEQGVLKTQHLKNDDYVTFSENTLMYEIYLSTTKAIIQKENLDINLKEKLYPEIDKFDAKPNKIKMG